MSKKSKFCIISTQRSGSTWLVQLLNSHNRIKTFNAEPFYWRHEKEIWFDDIFIPYYHYKQNSPASRPWVMFKYLNILETYDSEPHDLIGFKIMYNQIKENPEFLIKILLDKYRIIHMVRKNHLDVLISQVVGQKYGVYHIKKSNTVTRSVFIDTSSLIKTLDFHENKYQLVKAILNILPLPVLEVNYESLVSDKNKTSELILDFLQVDSKLSTLESPLKKVNPGSYKDKITNYEQVEKIIKQHPKYAHFITE